jgi:hypothetical protein
MNRKTLVSLIILDLVIMLIAVSIFLFRYVSLVSVSSITKALSSSPAAEPKNTLLTPDKKTAETNAENSKDVPKLRNIKFTFRNSKSTKVEIVGDFNNWEPGSMEKGPDNVWSITLSIAPGEYAYNFVVDGLVKRDPNNPKVCNVGRGFPNSFLKLDPISR